MQLVHGLRFDNIRGDVYGGLTAAVVALPLALAFGVASGAGPVAGLYGAVFVDLITAVAVGIVLASLLFVKRMSDLQLANIRMITHQSDEPLLSAEEKTLLNEAQGRVVLYHLSGPFSFGAAKGMARRLGAANEYDVLVFDLTDVPFLDSSASLALEDAITQAQKRSNHVFLVGVRPEVAKTLKRLGVTKLLPPGRHNINRVNALRQAVALANPAANPAAAAPCRPSSVT